MAGIDISIVALYFVLILGVGIWTGRKEENTRDFFVGNRQIPWIAVLCSIVATEISAATFLGVPEASYNGNMNYLQFGIGSLLARFFIAFLFISAFYKFDCLTVYEYLSKRFGGTTRYTATIFFFLGRVLGSGVRLLMAAIGLSVVMGININYAIMLFALIAIIYTAFGGIKAIVWTDVIQVFIFIGGGIAVLVYIVQQFRSTGQLDNAIKILKDQNKFEVFRMASTKQWFADANIYWLAMINGLVTTFAALGTDQDMTQRMLTCKDTKSSQKSLILSGFVGIPVMTLFLFIGLGVYAYYQINPIFPVSYIPLVAGCKYTPEAKEMFPYFITNLPVGLKGLLLIGIFSAAMSSLDSALGALSSSSVIDIYKPLINKNASENHYLKVS
ncbi:MAG: sodium/solute symporter, partial [bacterium]